MTIRASSSAPWLHCPNIAVAFRRAVSPSSVLSRVDGRFVECEAAALLRSQSGPSAAGLGTADGAGHAAGRGSLCRCSCRCGAPGCGQGFAEVSTRPLSAGGHGERAHVSKNLVQLRLSPSNIALACERELQQGGGEGALRCNHKQAGPPHHPCGARSGPQSCRDVGGVKPLRAEHQPLGQTRQVVDSACARSRARTPRPRKSIHTCVAYGLVLRCRTGVSIDSDSSATTWCEGCRRCHVADRKTP